MRSGFYFIASRPNLEKLKIKNPKDKKNRTPVAVIKVEDNDCTFRRGKKMKGDKN